MQQAKQNNNVITLKNLPKPKGLFLMQKLSIEQSRTGRSGVDIEPVKLAKNFTGQKSRAKIGLPEMSEPQVVRHFTRLSTKNYSIDSGFFPLGSCTMKHNPRLNEKLGRMPQFTAIHPYQPESSVQGALQVVYELGHWIAELTGLPSVTLSPAAGAHGEFTGILMIKKALEKKGEKRKYILIPESAHGTNPATATMCGFQIINIPATSDGLTDLAAVQEKIKEYGKEIAGVMLTNPNTCGLFEKNAHKIADLVHGIGGYFYCDGANFNAIIGKIRPSDFGVDVMHLNLHKTVSTPHGGGGPGCCAVAATAELEEFLPIPVVIKKNEKYSFDYNRPNSMGRVKGFYGQFNMMVRALTYLMSHGADGLAKVAEDAVLNANYILSKLENHYYVPFKGRCTHECLLNDKYQKEQNEVTTLDIAKSLIEGGYHPMTTFFPLVVTGAMLIEPTETETKETIDEFIEEMIMISEMAKSSEGATKLKQNPVSTPRKRMDEVLAARNPVLTWNELLDQ